MRARYHGEQLPQAGLSVMAQRRGESKPTFGFMFGNLTDDPANRLPESQDTIDALSALGAAMAEDPSASESTIPAAYTYFGQFIDHDITKTVFDLSLQPPGGDDPIQAANFTPIERSKVASLISNSRSATLDLDSVYEGLAKQAILPDGTFKLGLVQPTKPPFGPIKTSDGLHDLPRRPLKKNPQTPQEEEEDRQALIGDPRNDENLIVAQLHLGILRSHNVLVRKGQTFAQAQTAIRRRYQRAVIHDFLHRICDKSVVDDVLKNGPQVLKVIDPADVFMPLEFAVAGYRFGHSMIRSEYSHNSTFNPIGVPATFNFMFTFTALSGDLQPGDGPDFEFSTLPDNWPIEWHRFFGTVADPASLNPARRIDTNLTPELGVLRNFQGVPIQNVMGKLAARNLLRGYLLGLPTGQAVADRLGVPRVSITTLRNAVPAGLTKIVEDARFFERTPLWFYILAEAGDPKGADGQHLGLVGSRIVAETLWNLVKHSKDSVLSNAPSAAELNSGEFTLKGLIKIGQDPAMPPIVI